MKINNPYWGNYAILLMVLMFVLSCEQQSIYHTGTTSFSKQKGAHVFSIREQTDFKKLETYNIDWITMVPWGFQRDIDDAKVGHHRGDSTQIARHDSIWISRIQMTKEAGFSVFLKPHLWINEPTEGKWRSDVFPTNDTNWVLWKDSYRDFILRYATIAELSKADMFCIGIEMTRLTLEKPEYWEELIREVRAVYSGKITYAANWYEEYENISFWDQLDYIGIQGYFPLSNYKNPSFEQICRGWRKHIRNMKRVHRQNKRPIIFTELGYKSTDDSAREPWLWIEHGEENQHALSFNTQSNCYRAFFEEVWTQDWFAGVHIWQIRTDHQGDDGYNNLDFTPQGKPAETIIQRAFEEGKNKKPSY